MHFGEAFTAALYSFFFNIGISGPFFSVRPLLFNAQRETDVP